LRNFKVGLSWYLSPGFEGPAMESPISHLYENKLFVYQPGGENGNFGRVFICEFGKYLFIYENFFENNFREKSMDRMSPREGSLEYKIWY